jgi:hypothetical protein
MILLEVNAPGVAIDHSNVMHHGPLTCRLYRIGAPLNG